MVNTFLHGRLFLIANWIEIWALRKIHQIKFGISLLSGSTVSRACHENALQNSNQSVSLHVNGHLPGEPGLAGVH